MLWKKKPLRMSLFIGVAACLLIGGAVFYGQADEKKARPYIPEMGLPDGSEFLNLVEETRLYWGSKIDFASYLPKKLPQSKPVEQKIEPQPEPVLYVEKFDDPEDRVSMPVTPVLEEAERQAVSDVEELPIKEQQPIIVEDPAPPPALTYEYDIEDDALQVEGVLVPKQTTVISSSRDGKIKEIMVDNGDLFLKDDILLTYDCKGLNAEIEAMSQAESLAKQKAEKSFELFKLDIISDLEKMELQVEKEKTLAQSKALQAELDSCVIRASYDGRVTNRLANPQEYTRTDRVLMEVASRGTMDVEFIVPSKWLRYLNTGAPIQIRIAETDRLYQAEVVRIYGEVDPVSQSIQMRASLREYSDPLLPGMSGLVEIDPVQIRQSGVRGYLEVLQNAQQNSPQADTSRLHILKEKVQKEADQNG